MFPDKDALIPRRSRARSIRRPARPSSRAIDRDAAVARQAHHRDRDAAASRRQVWQLMSMLGIAAPPEARRPPPAQMDDSRLRAALAKLFEPHRDELRCAPDEAARFLRAIAFAGTHPRHHRQTHDPARDRRRCCSTASARATRRSLMLWRCSRTYLAPYTPSSRLVVLLPARRHDRVAVPAEHQRRHHRRRRRHRRHRRTSSCAAG